MTLNNDGNDMQGSESVVVDGSQFQDAAQTNGSQGSSDGNNAAASETDVQSYKPPDQSVLGWNSYTWWMKVKVEILYIPITLLLILMAPFMLLIASSENEHPSSSHIQRQRQQQRRQPSTSSELQLTSPTTTISPPARDPITYSFGISTRFPPPWRKTIDRLCLTICLFAPFWLSALWITSIINIGGPLKQDTTSCLTREHEKGFRGNSDSYGLGVRLGIYFQWIAATLAMRFMPSARHLVVGSYVLLQGGAALVCIPFHTTKKSFSERSRHVRLEIMFVVIGIAIFAIASWFNLRLWLHDEKDFMESPGGTTEFFMLGNVPPTNVWEARRFRGWLTLFRFVELIHVLRRDKVGSFLFSELIEWTVLSAMDLASGGLAMLINFAVKAVIWGNASVCLAFDLTRGTPKDKAATDKDEHSDALGICQRLLDRWSANLSPSRGVSWANERVAGTGYSVIW
ncbi:hypothetical protein LTR70_010275 [Exophiala xenobiotica]|uniref:Uncharacterized protein n=1 Tax=Lithohypha guttulata TaxID=1690604 RepID=A0ABR0JUG7_9EURO|nr:hypothetical protein LTR24_010267 [Lithohypha guttulata]KAK5309445.1 hypothetical protein LTR70_010275 [Exophiala xenobiotica]